MPQPSEKGTVPHKSQDTAKTTLAVVPWVRRDGREDGITGLTAPSPTIVERGMNRVGEADEQIDKRSLTARRGAARVPHKAYTFLCLPRFVAFLQATMGVRKQIQRLAPSLGSFSFVLDFQGAVNAPFLHESPVAEADRETLGVAQVAQSVAPPAPAQSIPQLTKCDQ